MTVTPAIILLFITMLFCQDNKGLTIFAVVIFMLSGYPKSGLDRIKTLSKQIVTRTIGQEFAQKKESVKEIEKCLLSIPEDERDSIWNYNDAFSTVFYQSGIIAQNNIPPVLSYHKQKLTKDMQMRQDVMLARPKWLLKTNIPSKLLNKPMWISKSYEPWYLSPADSIFIENNYYIIGGSEKSNYQLLKRKDEK